MLTQLSIPVILVVVLGWPSLGLAHTPDQALLDRYQEQLSQQSVLVYSQPDLEFGGLSGNFVALITGEGYRFVFLTQYAQDLLVTEIPVRTPRETDAFFDIVIHKVFSIGPKESKDLVIEQSYSRPKIGGGGLQKLAELYRLESGSARHLKSFDEMLTGGLTEAKKQKLQTSLRAQVNENPAGILKVGFSEIPQGYIYYSGRERLELLNKENGRLLVDDPKNGYLKIAGDAGLPGIILVMFTRRDAPPLYALQIQDTVSNHTFFLEQNTNGWQDVSVAVMPDYDKNHNYQLPRYGTTVTIDTAQGQKKLDWNKQVFALKK